MSTSAPRVLTPETDPDHSFGPADIFLAGGITGCPDWQARAIDLIAASAPDLTVANPRRSQAIPDQGIEAMAQIAWEHRNLATASLIAFWFAAGQVQPIALFELGKALGRGQALVVGADPGYPRLLDVTVQTALERSDHPIHDTLEDLVDAAINHPTTEKGN